MLLSMEGNCGRQLEIILIHAFYSQYFIKLNKFTSKPYRSALLLCKWKCFNDGFLLICSIIILLFCRVYSLEIIRMILSCYLIRSIYMMLIHKSHVLEQGVETSLKGQAKKRNSKKRAVSYTTAAVMRKS